MLDAIAIAALTFAATLIGYAAGAITEYRRNRRKNAATASCLVCEWTSGPVPLGEAFKLAEAHTAMPHPAGTSRTLVERAQ